MLHIRSRHLVIVVLLLSFLGACRQQAVVTPTLEPATPEATTAAPTPAPAADAWAAVQQRGRLIVGTSADYPPFAFYTEAFELDGFDVALARLLGERLGVEVEFSDMAFDGLGGALAVGQIDAAIAAISVTEARRAVVDFSNVYHVSEDAALARIDTGIALRSLADLAPYRVGVQEGSVYQTWLQEAGVATGVLSPDNLLAYTETTAAVDDLIAGRVDVLIADRLPLEVVARDDAALAIVGRGLNEQRFAVALPIGSNLTPRINEALAALQAEGALAELAARYLSLEEAELAPLPTIVDDWTVSVPRFDIAPPRPPEVLFPSVELLRVRIPPGWTLMPPPLTGAPLSMIADRVIVASPLLMRPPPPTLVVVLPENAESSTVSVAPLEFAMAPPFAALLLENVALFTTSVPLF